MTMGTSSILSVGVRRVSQTYSNSQWLIPHLAPFILIAVVAKLLARYNDFYLVLLGLQFTARYYRFFINLYGNWAYEPSAVPENPLFGPKDITLILCTVSVSESDNPGFEECLTTLLLNKPARVIVVTDTEEREEAAKARYSDICIKIRSGSSHFLKDIGASNVSVVEISFIHTNFADKRTQLALAIPLVRTPLIVTFDDHVFVRPRFLREMAAVFEDPRVGLCGTKKEVRRIGFATATSRKDYWGRMGALLGHYWRLYWNFLGIVYLTRHNFELRATSGMDGGVFVISGRAMALRTKLVQSDEFLEAFTKERINNLLLRLIRLLGIRCSERVKIGDDNFITTWALKQGYLVKFQDTDDATVETTLGEPATFWAKCRRYRRTAYYWNVRLLLTSSAWRRWPWTIWLAYIPGLFNLALVWDFGMIFTLRCTRFSSKWTILCLCVWIYFTKLVKLLPHFRRYPQDFVLFYVIPAYFVFVYLHSLLSVYSCLTFWDQTWEGRALGTQNIRRLCGHRNNPAYGDERNKRGDACQKCCKCV